MLPLLTLRLKQFGRIIKEIGLPLLVVGLFAVSGFLFSGWASIRDMESVYAIGAIAVFILGLDLIRKDKAFLKQVFGHRIKISQQLFFEYSLVVLPILLFQLVNAEFLVVLASLLVILIIALISPSIVRFRKMSHKRSIHWIPLKYYELKFFLEQKPFAGAFIMICLFGGAIHISLWILGMVLSLTIIGEAFTPMEPIEMMNTSFIGKLINNLKVLVGVNLIPVIVIFLLDPGQWYILLYGLVSIIVVTVFMISYKYANYNGLTSRLFSTALPTVFMFLTLIPGFIIVTIIMAFFYFFKAQKNLSYVNA